MASAPAAKIILFITPPIINPYYKQFECLATFDRKGCSGRATAVGKTVQKCALPRRPIAELGQAQEPKSSRDGKGQGSALMTVAAASKAKWPAAPCQPLPIALASIERWPTKQLRRG